MLQTALIGLGRHALEHHAPALADSRYAKLVAACDPDFSRADDFCAQYRVPVYSKAEELFSKEKLDFVLVAVPHQEYSHLLTLAVRNGVHVLKEKPFARSLAEGRKFNSIFAKADLRLATHVQRRYSPNYRRIHILKGKIGKIFWMEIRYTLSTSPHTGWRGSATLAGGGCIIDMGYHMIDLVLWYLGLPDTVQAFISKQAIPSANYDAEDSAQILFGYDGGCIGSCLLSRVNPPKGEFIKMIGTNGILELENGILYYRGHDGTLIQQFEPERSSNHIDEFCHALQQGLEHPGSPVLHMEHLAFIESCYRSAKTRRRVNPHRILEPYYDSSGSPWRAQGRQATRTSLSLAGNH